MTSAAEGSFSGRPQRAWVPLRTSISMDLSLAPCYFIRNTFFNTLDPHNCSH